MNLLLMSKVIARSPVTWLTMLAGVLSVVASELGAVLGADHPLLVLLARAVVWIGVAISIIRQVTPVLKPARGILPKIGEPTTPNEQWALNELAHHRTVVGDIFREGEG